MSTPPSNHNITQWGKALLKFAKVFLSNVMRDADGVIVHQAAHSSRWRTENVDNIFVFSKEHFLASDWSSRKNSNPKIKVRIIDKLKELKCNFINSTALLCRAS